MLPLGHIKRLHQHGHRGVKVRELSQGGLLDVRKDSSSQLSSETLTTGRPQVPQVALVGTLKLTGCLMGSSTMLEGHWLHLIGPQKGRILP